MRFEHRKFFYIVFGLIPGLIPLILAGLGFYYGTAGAIDSIVNSERKNLISIVPLVIFCLSVIYSYICGYLVIFKKEKIIKVRTVVSGLVLGIVSCAAYSFLASYEPVFSVIFSLPAIVGICLVAEIITRDGKKICT